MKTKVKFIIGAIFIAIMICMINCEKEEKCYTCITTMYWYPNSPVIQKSSLDDSPIHFFDPFPLDSIIINKNIFCGVSDDWINSYEIDNTKVEEGTTIYTTKICKTICKLNQ